MYADDSFHTLTTAQQAGLLAVSLALALCVLWLARRLAAGRALPVRLGIGALLFWMFVWLSPQVYYGYYILIIPGLPWQNVIGPPPWPGELGRVMLAQTGHNLSAHGKMALGWAVFLAVTLRMPQRSELTAP